VSKETHEIERTVSIPVGPLVVDPSQWAAPAFTRTRNDTPCIPVTELLSPDSTPSEKNAFFTALARMLDVTKFALRPPVGDAEPL
jgi:hypothetical protein